jgi:hypothetical protein
MIGTLLSWVNLRMNLFGVSAILCSTSSIFSAVLFVGHLLPFLRRTLPVSKNMFTDFLHFLDKLVSALKVRKLLLKFLKNSRCRIGPFAVLL